MEQCYFKKLQFFQTNNSRQYEIFQKDYQQGTTILKRDIKEKQETLLKLKVLLFRYL
jgi:flagellar motor switch protein FliG